MFWKIYQNGLSLKKPMLSLKGTWANLINSRLKDLKREIKNMSKQEKETEDPDEIVNLVENILEFNRQQQGQGLKILAPSQMLSRLPISLVQLKAGNNSEKLKSEIGQLLYSLYRSQKNHNFIKV